MKEHFRPPTLRDLIVLISLLVFLLVSHVASMATTTTVFERRDDWQRWASGVRAARTAATQRYVFESFAMTEITPRWQGPYLPLCRLGRPGELPVRYEYSNFKENDEPRFRAYRWATRVFVPPERRAAIDSSLRSLIPEASVLPSKTASADEESGSWTCVDDTSFPETTRRDRDRGESLVRSDPPAPEPDRHRRGLSRRFVERLGGHGGHAA